MVVIDEENIHEKKGFILNARHSQEDVSGRGTGENCRTVCELPSSSCRVGLASFRAEYTSGWCQVSVRHMKSSPSIRVDLLLIDWVQRSSNLSNVG